MAGKKLRAIMISVPYQGHINPFVNLALKLASRGFAITFVHLEFVHHRLTKAHHGSETEVDLFSEARGSGLDISYTTIPDGFPLDFDRDTNFEEYWTAVQFSHFRPIVDEFVGKIIQSDPHSIHFLIVDTIYTWLATIAEKHNLVSVSFWTQSAAVFAICYYTDLLKQNGHFLLKDGHAEEEITYIPGIKSINTKDLMPAFKEVGLASVAHKVYVESFKGVKKADFIIHNTVEELEFDALSPLNKLQPNYAIGPINFLKNLASNSISRSLWSESDCTDWLDPKPPGSVLYVSFGSFVRFTKKDVEEIAYGLLDSGVNFIWVVRSSLLNTGDSNILPNGFEDKIKDKGLVISWCNQIKILSHPSMGGFLTHNGWNSTVESMWCGVPMICHPIDFDQPTNRKLVIGDWKIGVNFCDGPSLDRKEVAEKIKSFMSGPKSKSLRDEANKVKAIMRNAMESNGSSERNFDKFVKDLEAKLYATTKVINGN